MSQAKNVLVFVYVVIVIELVAYACPIKRCGAPVWISCSKHTLLSLLFRHSRRLAELWDELERSARARTRCESQHGDLGRLCVLDLVCCRSVDELSADACDRCDWGSWAVLGVELTQYAGVAYLGSDGRLYSGGLGDMGRSGVGDQIDRYTPSLVLGDLSSVSVSGMSMGPWHGLVIGRCFFFVIACLFSFL